MPKKKVPTEKSKKPTRKYSNKFFDKYKDPRWQEVRLRVFEEHDFECSDCGSKDKMLCAHHKYYKKGLNPWEYPIEDIDCLCVDCHGDLHDLKDILTQEIGMLGFSGMEEILGYTLAIKLFYGDADEIELKTYEMCVGVARYFKLDERKIVKMASKNRYKINITLIKSVT